VHTVGWIDLAEGSAEVVGLRSAAVRPVVRTCTDRQATCGEYKNFLMLQPGFAARSSD
jgi:hypothetical protein